MAKEQPLLLHTLVAVSATHMSNLVESRGHILSPSETARYGTQESPPDSQHHSLVAKHKAISLLRHAVQAIESSEGDLILAAVVFLTELELIESGKQGWRAHLIGAMGILSRLPPATPRNQALRDLLFSDIMVYFVMGSTFLATPPLQVLAMFPGCSLSNLLERAAAYSYNGCPAEMLEIMYMASQFSNITVEPDNQEKVTSAGRHLIERAQHFDVSAWARDEENFRTSRAPGPLTRFNSGEAFRLAIILYIMRSIPSIYDAERHAKIAKVVSCGIVQHASSVPENDPALKVITWPTFVVGADSMDTMTRDWAMGKLQLLFTQCPWGFLNTAMDALNKIWARNNIGIEHDNWIKFLKEQDMDFVVI
ncbi:hypothetical protein HIM_06182 [Hirsutella minnesotensis 3608]|uniref:Acriflavine sensitivity control protein acr-2 n=1 Tax=Hirsutella minnesotensis 3608 TaxID=1043627 RepID=A0A0F7ZZK3_9HYPO|nr:hypothetical protein HIM_06182 [Hirsutella minnesotensis 3608]